MSSSTTSLDIKRMATFELFIENVWYVQYTLWKIKMVCQWLGYKYHVSSIYELYED